MTRLTIELPDDLRATAEARAAQSGHASVEEYVQELLRADAESAFSALNLPEHLAPRNLAQLESMIEKGMVSPAREMTPAEWEQNQLRRLAERHPRPDTQAKAG